MNCTCVKDIEKRLPDVPFIKAKAGENITAECMATGFQLDHEMGLKTVVSIPFRIRGTGRGFSSAKGKEAPCAASFCPFCGRSTGRYVVGDDDGIAAAMGAAA